MRKWKGMPITMDLYDKLSNPYFLATHREREKIYVRRWEFVAPSMAGMILKIHTGKRWFYKFITPEDAGYRFGEFVDTRTQFIHLRRRKMKKRRNQGKKRGG